MIKISFIKALQITHNTIFGVSSKEAFMTLVSKCPEARDNILKKLKWREENSKWLNKSAKIAIKVLRELRSQGLSKEDLAKLSDIPIERINEIVKGSADITLCEIYKLSNKLNIKL